MQEMRVQPPGQEALLDKYMATHSSIFAWEIPWTKKLGGLQSMKSQGEYMYTHGWFMSMYGKNYHNVVK